MSSFLHAGECHTVAFAQGAPLDRGAINNRSGDCSLRSQVGGPKGGTQYLLHVLSFDNLITLFLSLLFLCFSVKIIVCR